MNGKLSSALKITLSSLLAAGLLVLAFRGTDWKNFTDGLSSTHWGWIMMSVAAALAALVLRAERWRLQLTVLDPSIGRNAVWHGSNIGNFFSLILPGSGEFIRCGYVSTGKAKYDKVFGTIVVERLWDIIAVATLFTAALVSNNDVLAPFMKDHITGPLRDWIADAPLWVAAVPAVLILVFIITVFIFRDRIPFFSRCAGAVRGIGTGMKAFLRMDRKTLFLVYTAGIWMMYILMTYFTILGIKGMESFDFRDAVFISAVGNIASIIPTPGNLGAYHYLVGLAISTIYLGSSGITDTALLCATLSHGTHALLLIVLGLCSYIWTLHNKKR